VGSVFMAVGFLFLCPGLWKGAGRGRHRRRPARRVLGAVCTDGGFELVARLDR